MAVSHPVATVHKTRISSGHQRSKPRRHVTLLEALDAVRADAVSCKGHAEAEADKEAVRQNEPKHFWQTSEKKK